MNTLNQKPKCEYIDNEDNKSFFLFGYHQAFDTDTEDFCKIKLNLKYESEHESQLPFPGADVKPGETSRGANTPGQANQMWF